MLGYVIPDKSELKVREYEIYTGYYCGICKYIGKTYGQLPRMALSYDAAFIALLLASVDPAPDAPRQEHCAVHHIKYKTVIRNRAIEYSGDLMLILAWFKLLDDAQDEGKVSAKAGLTSLRHIYRKLEKKHPSLCALIDRKLRALNQLERENCRSIDRVAEGFAQVMDGIFRDGITWLYGPEEAAAAADQTEEKKPTLHETFAKLGYHLGKWIYLIDAADDIEKDLENGTYNPLLYRFEYRDDRGTYEAGTPSEAETADQFRARIDERLRFNLYHYLAVISESVEDLDIKKNYGIIENVIYFGLNRRTDDVLKRIQPVKRRRIHESI